MKIASVAAIFFLIIMVATASLVIQAAAPPPVSRQVAVIAQAGPGATTISTTFSTTGTEKKLVVVFIMIGDSARQTVSWIVDDGPGLPYSQIMSVNNPGAATIELWQAESLSNFQGNTLTATVSLPSTLIMTVLVYTGQDPTLPLRVPRTDTGRSNNPSLSYLANGRVLLVGALAVAGSTTISAGASYSVIAEAGAGQASPNARLTGAVEERTGTAIVDQGTYTVDFSLNPDRQWAFIAVGISEKMPLVGGTTFDGLSLSSTYIGLGLTAVAAGALTTVLLRRRMK